MTIIIIEIIFWQIKNLNVFYIYIYEDLLINILLHFTLQNIQVLCSCQIRKKYHNIQFNEKLS